MCEKDESITLSPAEAHIGVFLAGFLELVLPWGWGGRPACLPASARGVLVPPQRWGREQEWGHNHGGFPQPVGLLGNANRVGAEGWRFNGASGPPAG